MSNCLVDDFVTLSDPIVHSDFRPIDYNLANYDGIFVVLQTECLELALEELKQL